uniref:Uncharacterized protein n=1 Tax=viral metagenome TaxID=1070528 RepID=A0A6M3KZ81_9ZZZZ
MTGFGPTKAIYEGLSEHYDVAVLDQAPAQELFARTGSPVACVLNAVEPPMHEWVRNKAAVISSQIFPLMNRGFSVDGVQADGLSEPTNWLPGITLGHVSDCLLVVRALDAYAESVSVAGVVVHEDVTPRFRAMAMWAKGRGLPVVHMPHNNCYVTVRPDVHDHSMADWILAPSPYAADWYIVRGYDEKRVRIVCFPPWDDWRTVELPQDRARRVLMVEDKRAVVVLCTGWAQRTNLVDDHGLVDAAVHLTLGVAKKRGWFVLWKLHPGDHPNREDGAARLMAAYRVTGAVMRGHLSYALAAADAVLSVGPSNVLVEAGIMNRVPLLFGLPGYGFEKEPPYVVGYDESDIVHKVEACTGQEWSGRARDQFVKRYAYRDDGGATKRAVKALARIFK